MFVFGLLGISIPVTLNWKEYIIRSRDLTLRGLFLVLATGLAISGYYLCLFYALEISPRIEASIINFLWPIIFVVLSWFFLEKKRTRISIIETLLLLLAFIGAILVAVNDRRMEALTTFHPGYIAAFCAAIFAGTYLVLIEKVRVFYKKNHFIYFSALLLSTPILYLYHLGAGVELVMTKNAIIFYVYMGLIVFSIGQLAWVYALEHYQTVIIASIAYLTPVISIVLLNLVLHDSISANAVFGISLILIANVALHSKYWYSSSTMGSFLVLIFTGVACYVIDGQEKQENFFVIIELFGLMFGIIVAFTLQRMSERVREQEWKFNEISESIQILLIDSEDKLEKKNYDSVRLKVDNLLQKLIVYDYERNPVRKEKYAEEMFSSIYQLNTSIVDYTKGGQLLDIMQNIQEKVGQWVLSKSQKLSVGEMTALWMLGLAAVFFLFISRANTFYGDIATIVFSSSVVFLLLVIRDYNLNRPERDFTKLMVSQEIFKRNGFDYFLPKNVLSSRQFPMPTSKHTFRCGIGKDGQTEMEEIAPEPSVLNYYKNSFSIFTVVALLVLLYSKHI